MIRVAPIVHSMDVAGAEMLVAATVRQLLDRIEPTIICLDREGRMAPEMRDLDVEIVTLDRPPGFSYGTVRRLANVLAERRIQVVHAHQYGPFFYAALARLARGAEARIILTEHGRHYPDTVHLRRRFANRWLLARAADRVNACSEFSARALRDNDGFRGGPIEVIPNGIEVERYGPAADRALARRALGLAPDRRYAVTVARFHPVKDHASLIAGFARVAAERQDTDLILIGDGPEREARERQVEELGLTGRIQFWGIRRDVPQILSCTDLFVMTSLSEASSLTLMEAMASGMAVVVTAVGGNPEIVRDGVDGCLVPRGDTGAIGDALARLLDDEALRTRMGGAGRARVHEHFRLEDTIHRYAELYEELA